jgi:ubiquinone biosynthesis protein UbiJ
MLDIGLADQIATAAIETTFNKLIQDNAEHARRLSRLKGRVLQVHLIEMKKTLTFVFSQQVDVLAHYEGAPDCYLSLHVSILPQLKDQNNITRLIKQEKIDVEGDLKLAQHFSQLMEECKPDIEEWISRVTGDVVAHTVVQGAREMTDWLKQQSRKHQNHVAQVLTEEWKIAPGPLEVAYFCDQVSDLSDGLTPVEERLKALATRINNMLEKA